MHCKPQILLGPKFVPKVIFMLLNCHPDVLHAVVVVLDGGGVPPDPLHAPLEHEPLLGHVPRQGAVSAAGKLVQGGVEPATLEGLVQGGPLVWRIDESFLGLINRELTLPSSAKTYDSLNDII